MYHKMRSKPSFQGSHLWEIECVCPRYAQNAKVGLNRARRGDKSHDAEIDVSR